jgi:phytanoyl-CoA hydroxylase
MLSPEQIAFFNKNGYVLGGKVLTDEQVEILREETLRVIRDRQNPNAKQPVLCHTFGDPKNPIWQIVNIWQASEPFFKFALSNLTICEEVAQLHDDANALRIWHDQIQYKEAGTGGVNNWHQDSPYWGILTPKHAQVTAWVALDDVDADNGCMSMVPGSHLWGNHVEFVQTVAKDDFQKMAKVGEFQGHRVEVKLCPVKKGHVHYHHSLTWHGSHANTSNRPRRAIALHYMTNETRYVAKGNHVMKQFVEVNDGEVMKGEAFPMVYEKAGVTV